MRCGDQPSQAEEETVLPAEEKRDAPRHGFQGDRAPPPPRGIPASLTIAVSREAGSRGNTIGSRAGVKLGWPVYNQELLGYIAQEGAIRQNMDETLSVEAVAWAEERLAGLLREKKLSPHQPVVDLARSILLLGAQGNLVIIGRGAGCILPRETTLNVRVIAPHEDRVAYISQWLRLSRDESAEQVRVRDKNRADFLATHFHHQPDVYQYDLILNSTFVGEDVCAQLIVQAAKAKLAALNKPGSSPTFWLQDPVP